MKTFFYTGLACIALFDALSLYLVMPTPGTHNEASLVVAHYLEDYQWYFRGAFVFLAAQGSMAVFRTGAKWRPLAALAATVAVVWVCNFQIAPDYVFEQPGRLSFDSRARSSLGDDDMVIGVVHNGEAKAYPIRYMIYHHQVRDRIGGKKVMVTYCNICRTARVHEPLVDGREAVFRMVGVNRGNSIYEDSLTQSWWMQATGEAEAGLRDGRRLKRVDSVQVTARKWFEMHPNGVVMRPDPMSIARYAPEDAMSASVEHPKSAPVGESWVIGVEIGLESKSYGWKRLNEMRIINDQVGETPLVLVLGADGRTFAAFERPSSAQVFALQGLDMISAGDTVYDFAGRDLADPARRLRPVPASLELAGCWEEFHPSTLTYDSAQPGKS